MRRVLPFALLAVTLSTSAYQSNYQRMLSAVEGNNVAQVRQLLASKLSPNSREDSRSSPTFLTHAAYHGRLEIVQALLSAGASINASDGDLRTPLMQAAAQGHLEIVRLLLRSGAMPQYRDRWGQTALEISAAAGHAEIARILEATGASR
jgi:uncharacterized protein